MKPKIVVYTDLDGTLLDENYSYQDIKSTLDQLLALDASLVFCSSKTRAEIEIYRKELRNNEPFITENGSAIYIPQTYFTTAYSYKRQTGSYNLIELGMPYHVLREKLAKAKLEVDAEIVGFGDMTAEELSKDAGLMLPLARLAKQREYDEPFRITKEKEAAVAAALSGKDVSLTRGGRYWHIMGKTDKGKATVLLTDLYKKQFGEVFTIGVGDGENDSPMLKVVDHAFMIQEAKKENNRQATWKKIAHTSSLFLNDNLG